MNQKIFIQSGSGIALLVLFYFICVQSNIQYAQASKLEQEAINIIDAPKKLKISDEELQRVTQDLEYKTNELYEKEEMLQKANDELKQKEEEYERVSEKLNRKLRGMEDINIQIGDLVEQTNKIDKLSGSVDGVLNFIGEQTSKLKGLINGGLWDRAKIAWNAKEIQKIVEKFNGELNLLKSAFDETKEQFESLKENG